ELVKAAVKFIRARLRHHIDNRAGIAAVFCVEVVGDDAEFFDAVWRRLNGRSVYEQVVSIAPVDRVIVGSSTAAIYGDDSGLVRAEKEIVAKLRLYTWLQLQQLIDVALVQWQLRRGAVVHDGAQLRRAGVHHRRRAGNLN